MILFKPTTIKKLIFLCLPIFLYCIENPYIQLKTDEKINLLVNYFINQDLKNIIPPAPIKDKIKDNSKINPIKYELYFSYIQRLKAINDSRIEEQKIIDEQYAGQVGFYNGKLKKLQQYYNKEENLHPILQNSFNKTYKILYGQPKLKNVKFDKLTNKITGTVYIDSIYNYLKYKEQKIVIDIPNDLRDTFILQNRMSKVFINFDFSNNLLKQKDLTIIFNKKKYKANFINQTSKAIKLKIKINNDIFKPIEIEGNK